MQCAETLHEWNSRLQDVGFHDIELVESVSKSKLLDSDQQPEFNPKQEYYSKLYQRTNAEKFENKTHEFILRKKSEGAKIVDIVQELDSNGKKIHRETVRHVIRRFEHKWEIRAWSCHQMNLKDRTGS